MTSDARATRWLDQTEMRLWRAFLEANGRVIRRVNDGLKSAADLTLDDYEVLVHLSEADDRRLRMSDLSERLLHSQSRLSQRVDRLARRGYVIREKCHDDGRGTFAVLTAEGFDALTSAAPHHVTDVRAALVDLVRPDERTVLAEVLERLAEADRSADR